MAPGSMLKAVSQGTLHGTRAIPTLEANSKYALEVEGDAWDPAMRVLHVELWNPVV